MQDREHWEDLNVNGKDIKMDLKEVGWDMDWIHLAQSRDLRQTLVITATNLRVQ
jgi:hypothetical protein